MAMKGVEQLYVSICVRFASIETYEYVVFSEKG